MTAERVEDLARGLSELGCAPMSAQRTVEALYEQIEARHLAGAKLIDIWEYLARQIGVAPSSLSNCWARAKRSRRRTVPPAPSASAPASPTLPVRSAVQAAERGRSTPTRRKETPPSQETTNAPRKPGTFAPWADREV